MKYRLTEETIQIGGHILHRIECVTAFAHVKVGDKGGWIESEANLSQYGDAWVYGDARVYGNARVSGDARVYGGAKVCGDAEVYGGAKVCGDAEVYGCAEVYGDAKVCGDAEVCGNAEVYDNAWVCDKAEVCGNAEVSGYAGVYGYAKVCGDAKVCGNADYIVFKNWWSSGRYYTWTRSNNKWRVGCFYGTGEELIAKAYKDSEVSGREYQRVVDYVNSILQEGKI